MTKPRILSYRARDASVVCCLLYSTSRPRQLASKAYYLVLDSSKQSNKTMADAPRGRGGFGRGRGGDRRGRRGPRRGGRRDEEKEWCAYAHNS